MIAYINHNITAYAVRRTLSKHESQLSKSLERLASGNRINRAADDAAGMSISQRLKAESRGLQQFHRNVMRAQSVLSMAEGSAQNTSETLLKLKEWATQAASDTVTDEDRTAIQKAVNMLVNEVDSIVERTKFNERRLLDGSYNADVYLPSDTLSIALNTGIEDNGLTAVELGLIQPRILDTLESFSIGGVSIDVGPDAVLNNLDQVIPDLQPGDIIHINGKLPDGSEIDENASFIFGDEGTTLGDLIREINDAFLADDIDRGATASIVRNSNGQYTGLLRLTDNSLPTLDGLTPSQTSIRLTVAPVSTPPILTGNALDFSSPLPVTGDVRFSFILSSQNEELVDLDDVSEAGTITLERAKATVTGDNAVSPPYTIDGTNDEFKIEIINNGISTGQKTVTLAPGVFNTLGDLVNNINNALDTAFGEDKVDAQANINETITFTTVDYADTLILEEIDALAGLGFVSTFQSTDGNDGKYEDINVLVNELNSLIDENVNLSGKIEALPDGNKVSFRDKDLAGQITSLDIRGTALSSLGFPTPTPNDYTRSLFDPAEFGITQAGGPLDVSTRTAASNAISIVDTAVNLVSVFLANIGGFSSRLTRVESALSSDILNTAAAISVISDTDYAAEIAQLTRLKILQQAGTSILVHANMTPEVMLSLLP